MGLRILDTIMENPFLPVYCISVALAIWRYPHYFDTPLRYFPVLLMYTLLTEFLGVLIREYERFSLFLNDLLQMYNWLIYNIYAIISYLYFYYVFWCYADNKRHRHIIALCAAGFVIASVINLFIHSFLFEAQIYAYIAGALALILAAFLYFLKLKRKFGTWFLSNDLVSWVGLGLLIFYIGFIPIQSVRYYNALYGLNDPQYIRITLLLLILAMHACFITGFLRIGKSRMGKRSDDSPELRA